jgi:hypothetical protein
MSVGMLLQVILTVLVKRLNCLNPAEGTKKLLASLLVLVDAFFSRELAVTSATIKQIRVAC